MELTTFIHASAHDLHQLADGSVQMIATSPPYYGLRAYAGEQGVEWPEVTYRLNEWVEPTVVAPMRCGLGMEPTPVAFIGHLILCLREWRRVLRDDGTIWVNLGDSYYNYRPGGTSQPKQTLAPHTGAVAESSAKRNLEFGVKEKDLLGIPWLFAIAARADGWYLRSDIIWHKPNPMPESVTDRPTKAHEYVFLLSKSPKYFWDAEAVKEKSLNAGKVVTNDNGKNGQMGAYGQTRGGFLKDGGVLVADGRNIRTVWTIATQPTPLAHFATWPEKLVQTMIRAGSSERGACPHCGKAWVRIVEKSGGTTGTGWTDHTQDLVRGMSQAAHSGGVGNATDATGKLYTVTDLGFAPACTCPAHEPVPCVVLDPFNGSGTTGKVAVQLGRAYVGVDIAQEYLDGVTHERFGAGVQIGLGM
jgi:DNA modification methylase